MQLPFLQPFARVAEALAESRCSGGAVGVQKDGSIIIEATTNICWLLQLTMITIMVTMHMVQISP